MADDKAKFNEAKFASDLDAIPQNARVLADKLMRIVLADLPETMTLDYVSMQYLTVIFASEMMARFAERMLEDEAGISPDKVQNVRKAFAAIIKSKTTLAIGARQPFSRATSAADDDETDPIQRRNLELKLKDLLN